MLEFVVQLSFKYVREGNLCTYKAASQHWILIGHGDVSDIEKTKIT